MYLFLDDERKPKDVTWVRLPPANWEIVRNYEDFIETIEEKGVPFFISFDHDLADEHYPRTSEDWLNPKPIAYERYREKTGFECAKWLIEYCDAKNIPFPDYRIHSMNTEGKKNIQSLIESYKKSKFL